LSFEHELIAVPIGFVRQSQQDQVDRESASVTMAIIGG